MALSIKISAYVSGGYTGDIIRWKLMDLESGAYVDIHEEPGPHGQVYNFSFNNNIRDVVYRIEMYDVPPGAGVGNLIKAHEVTATTSTIDFNSDIELVVGGLGPTDPVDGTQSVIIPALLGKDFRVMQRAFGQLLRDRNVEMIPDIVNGGFALQGNLIFNQDDVYIVQILPKYVINPPGTVAGGGNYKDVVLVTADYTVLSTDFGKLFIVDSALAVITLTFPAINTLIEKIPLFIESLSTQIVLKGATGEVITALGATDNTFILGKAEKAQIIRLGLNLYGFTESEDAKRVGQIEMVTELGINRIAAYGGEYNAADFPRLVKRLNALPAGQVIGSFAAWNNSYLVNYIKIQTGPSTYRYTQKTVYPNHGFFALYSVSGIAKVTFPDLRNMSFRALNGLNDTERITNLPGGYQVDQFKEHTHESNNANSAGGYGKPTTGGDAQEAGNLIWYTTGGVENRPENIGLIPAIIV